MFFMLHVNQCICHNKLFWIKYYYSLYTLLRCFFQFWIYLGGKKCYLNFHIKVSSGKLDLVEILPCSVFTGAVCKYMYIGDRSLQILTSICHCYTVSMQSIIIILIYNPLSSWAFWTHYCSRTILLHRAVMFSNVNRKL